MFVEVVPIDLQHRRAARLIQWRRSDPHRGASARTASTDICSAFPNRACEAAGFGNNCSRWSSLVVFVFGGISCPCARNTADLQKYTTILLNWPCSFLSTKVCRIDGLPSQSHGPEILPRPILSVCLVLFGAAIDTAHEVLPPSATRVRSFC